MSNENSITVLVHGLWMTGLELSLLRRRLERSEGLEARQFAYYSVLESLDFAVDKLRRFVETLNADTLNFVAHSLGGLVTLHMLLRTPALPGRVL